MSLVGVEIKKFSKDKLDDCIQLIHNTINLCYPSIYSPEIIDFFIKYHNSKDLSKKASKGTMLLLFYNESLLVTGYLFKREIGGVYVHPGYQRMGLGKILVSKLLRIATDKKFDHVWLDATPIALDFYKSLGFTVTKECTDYVGNNTPLHYYRMYKKLL